MKSGTTPSPTATDTTQRRQAQALDSKALDYLPDGIFTCQFLAGNLTVAYANRAFKEMLGLPAHERVKGRSLRSLIGGLLSPEVLDTLHRAVSVRQRLILTLPTPAAAAQKRFRLDLRPASDDAGGDWVGSLGLAESSEPLELKSASFVPTGESGQPSETAGANTKHILDAAPGLICLRSSDTRFEFVNSAMAEFFGLDTADIVGRRWSELGVAQERSVGLRLPGAELLNSGHPVIEHDVPLTDALGRERRFDITHRVLTAGSVTEDNGGLRQTLSVATERLEAEMRDAERVDDDPHQAAMKLARDLARNEAALKEVAERVPGAIARWLIDEDGERLTFISEGAKRLTGHKSTDILKEPELLFSGTDRDSRAAFRRAVERARRDLSPFVLEFPVRHRDSDTRKWLRLSATARSTNEKDVFLEGVLTDATESKRQEHGILAARNQLYSLTSALPGVACQIKFNLMDRRRTYLFVSDGSRELFGEEPQECVRRGVLFEDSVVEEDVERVSNSLDLAVNTLSRWDLEFRVRDRRGTEKWVHAVAIPGDSSVDSVIFNATITDTSETRAVSERLATTEAQLKEALTGLAIDVEERKRLARALEGTRRRLNDIATTLPGALYRCEVVGGGTLDLTYVGDGARAILGIEPDQIMSEQQLLTELISKEDRPALERMFADCIDSMTNFEHEVRIRDFNGETKWVCISARSRTEAPGHIVIDGFVSDITAQKLAEQALADAREQLRHVTRTVPGAVFQCSVRDGLELSYISDAAKELFGIDPDDVIGPLQRLLSFCRNVDVGELSRRLSALSREVQPWQEELEILTADGRSRWLQLSAQAVQGADGVTYYHGVFIDSTDAKLAELRFADGERRLELALQSGGLGLLDWSIPTGRAIYNSELARMLGYDYDELGTNINRLHDLEHPRDSARKRAELQAHLNGETSSFSSRYRLRTKNGEWRWVSAQGRVVERGENGGALRYVGTIEDVTDRMEAERRLEQQVVFSRLITSISSDFMKVKADEIDRALAEALRTIARFTGAQQSYLCEDQGRGCMVVCAGGSDSSMRQTDRPRCESGAWIWLQKKAVRREFVQTPDVRSLPEEAANEREDLVRRGVGSFLMVPLYIGEQSLGWLGFEFTEPGRSWDDGELGLFRVIGEIITQTINRGRGERALQAAETRVSEITKAIPGAVAQVYRSPEGEFEVRYLSRALSGCSLEEAVADPTVILENMDPRDRRGLERSLARAAAELTPWQFDYRTRGQHGETIWVTASAYPTRMPDGGTLFNGIATDVTDRKRAEEALQRSEERFRVLYESTPVMMHSTDARGQIVNVNRKWLDTLGYTRAEAIGRRTEDFLTRASRLKLGSVLKTLSVSDDGGVKDATCQMIRRDGAFIDVLLSLRAERAKDRFLGVSVSTVNVSERNRALRALAESEERYRAVVRDQTDAICRFDRKGALQFANAPCIRFLGESANDLKGKSWFEWIEPAHREGIRNRLVALSPDDSLVQLELRMTGADNRWYQWTVRSFFSERGEPTGYQAVGRDIQELKTLEKEIREISDREQQRIGHDLHDGLGQELTGVSLMLKTLEQAVGKQAPDLQPRVSAVRDMVGQSIATTRALAQGLSPVHLERDGFGGALSQLAANVESMYGTPVRFGVVRGAPIMDLSVTTDLYRIAQEALNNAAKHANASQITVKLAVDREKLMLEIADDGCGIPEGASRAAGMGLKIMRYRARMIDASLDIIQRQGGGTIVRCTMKQPPGAGK